MSDTLVQSNTAPVPTVRVTQLAGDTLTLDHAPGVTVQQYLERAGVQLGHGEVVTVNAKPVSLDQTVEPGSVVVAASRVSNG